MNIGQLIASLVTLIKTDALKAAVPLLAQFFNSISSDPSVANVTVQLAKLNVDLLAALPGIEKDALAAIAQTLMSEAQSLATPHA